MNLIFMIMFQMTLEFLINNYFKDRFINNMVWCPTSWQPKSRWQDELDNLRDWPQNVMDWEIHLLLAR